MMMILEQTRECLIYLEKVAPKNSPSSRSRSVSAPAQADCHGGDSDLAGMFDIVQKRIGHHRRYQIREG
jgi:hypothetical protein